MHFFPYVTNTQAYHRKLENRKNDSLVGLTPVHTLWIIRPYLRPQHNASLEKGTHFDLTLSDKKSSHEFLKRSNNFQAHLWKGPNIREKLAVNKYLKFIIINTKLSRTFNSDSNLASINHSRL